MPSQRHQSLQRYLLNMALSLRRNSQACRLAFIMASIFDENPSCAPGKSPQGPAAGMAAGEGIGTRQQTKRHAGPYSNDGYLGDVPALYVGADGRATYPLLAPRLKSLKAFRGDNASHGQLHFLTQGKRLPVRVVGLE